MARRITRVSRAGVRLVSSFEGYRGHPYRDAVGVWTIGFGETQGIGPGTRPWSQRKAKRRLRRALNHRYAPAVSALHLPLTQPMFDALVSFAYNLGPGALTENTGVGRELRRHHWRKAANELLKWDRAGGRALPGLTRRRQAERWRFLAGT